MQKNNEHFKVNLIDTTQMDRPCFADYSVPAHTSIFMCGPEKNGKTLRKAIQIPQS